MAVSLELPLLIVDIQRGGPSTGLPTKTEQSDLLHAMYGRHGEAPVPIVAAMTPSHCFEAAMEAVRIAVTYRTPVFLLSDGYLANGSEPWRLPDVADLPDIDVTFATEKNHTEADGSTSFWPYIRDENLARPWAVPGTPGLEHRIGGLEKEDGTGNISYDPENHERMVHLRAAKVAALARSIPPLEVDDVDGVGSAPVLILGWGSTYGAIAAGVRRVRARGLQVAHVQLVHLNPFPSDLGDVLAAYDQVLVPEANLGQLSKMVRADFLVDAKTLSKVQGSPFRAAEIEIAVLEMLGVDSPTTTEADQVVAS
jgi:2-oxoglutarate ferredoxin oxidoreductase subunit alpha